jgi:hypothetical protein
MDEPAATKACPWCAETILAEAKKCKHCGEFLVDEELAPPVLPHQCDRCPKTFATLSELYLHELTDHRMHGDSPHTRTGTAARPPSATARVSAQMVCPHCGTRGRVTTAVVKQKKGISGAKATGVVLTGGLSALVTGLSKKAAVTMASCGECRMTWTIS